MITAAGRQGREQHSLAMIQSPAINNFTNPLCIGRMKEILCVALFAYGERVDDGVTMDLMFTLYELNNGVVRLTYIFGIAESCLRMHLLYM